MAEQYALNVEAADYLRARGAPVTPAKVESFVRERLAQNGEVLPGAAVDEIVTAVNALMQQANTQRKDTTMGKEQEFAGVTRDGKNAGVIKRERLEEAQQYQQPEDYFAEPRLSESRRAELEMLAEGLRAQLGSAQLTPSNRIRLQQELTLIERTLGKTNSADERRGFAR